MQGQSQNFELGRTILLLAMCGGFNFLFCYLVFFFFFVDKNKIIFISNFLKDRVIYFE